MHLIQATALIGGAGQLLRDEEHLLSLFPILRACVEASTTIHWLLDDESTLTRTRLARLYLERLSSIRHLILASDRKSQTRKSLKALERKLETHLAELFDSAEIGKDTESDGRHLVWASPESTIAGEQIPRLAKKAKLFGHWYAGQGPEFRNLYAQMALGAHPNPAYLEQFQELRFEPDVEGLRYLIACSLLVVINAVNLVDGFFGWAQDGLVKELGDVVAAEFTEDLVKHD